MDEKGPLVQAQQLIQAGSPEKAIPLIRQVLDHDPENAEAQYNLGVALLQSGKSTEALFPLSKAAASKEYATLAGVVLATTLADAANYEEAIAASERVLAVEPESQAALMVRARSAIALHRGDLALDSADRLLLISPDSVPLLHLKAQALEESDRPEDARALYEQLMEEPADEDPAGPTRACVALAKLQSSQKQEDDAVATLHRCEERFGEDPKAIPAIVAAWDSMERPDDALAFLERAVAAHPDAIELRTNLATRLVSAERFEDAEKLMREGIPEDGGTPEQWLALASVRISASHLEGALEAADRAIALGHPPSQAALFTRADTLIALGRLEEAEQASAALEPGLYRRTIEGRLAQQRGDLQRALSIYDKVLSKWPQNHQLRVMAAVAAMELGDAKRAKSELMEVTRQAPKETDAALWLARIDFAQGHYGAAAGFAMRQIQERGTAAPDAYLLASRAYVRNGQPKAARQVLAELGKTRDGLFVPYALAELARTAASSQGPAPALEALEKAIDKRKLDLADPSSEPALLELFELMVASGRSDEAQTRAAALASAHPDRPLLHVMEGRLALVRDDSARAEAAFARALELQPGFAPALAGQGLLLRRTGDLEAAIERMDAAWAAEKIADYGYMSARMKQDAGDLAGAESRFREVLVLHPDHAPSANDLAWQLAEEGRSLDTARSLAERALRLDPGGEVLDTLGFVLLKQGELEKAQNVLRRALEMKPDYATARYHLAVVLREEGDADQARSLLQEALQKPFPEAAQAKQLLVQIDAGDRS